ncbi:MAG: hypothetical protein DWQ36_02490 [Acidobacteria bacterium]|nr:MAG: hypothetical protein DWQ30_23880 [Acidobacteriota bacterium]REK11309.1 MAG: hypothetical protein DWQ36_02490 [Acidobacteriota bacterium]
MRSFLLADGRASVVVRRLITVTAYAALTALVVAPLPAWIIVATLVDLASHRPGRRWPLLRTLLFFACYLVCELLGVAIATALWLLRPMLGRRRYLRANFRLQVHWGSTLFAAGSRLFSFRARVRGAEHLEPEGPILLMIRHSSMADTVLAVCFVSAPHDIQLRYVLKRPLLLDPCLDIVGNRLPNWFSTHATPRRDRELAAVARLADDLGPRDGVLIYPEGTRFSTTKRTHQLERLARRGAGRDLERASRLRHVLLPRRGGPAALLLRNACSERPADLVFCAHTGFEGSATFGDLRRGALIGRTVEIEFWRVPASELPVATDGGPSGLDVDAAQDRLYDWLCEQWWRVDEFIDRHRGETEPSRSR